MVGLNTSVKCEVELVRTKRKLTGHGIVATLRIDGGDMTSPVLIPIGSQICLRFPQHADAEVLASTCGCQPHGLKNYLISFSLRDGSWPYELYSLLAKSVTTTVREQIPSCFVELGLTANCTVEAVEEAFSKKVRKVHPDRGGSVEAFVRLRQAFLDSLKLLGGRR